MVRPGDANEPSELAARVVHLDDDFAVLDKPAGLVVHPAPSHSGPTLVDQLRDLLAGGPDPERPGIVHRLDRDTSGLMVVARSDRAYTELQRQLRERRIERRYLALVAGRPGSRTGTVEAPIGRSPRRRTEMAIGGIAPRPARTWFEVVETFADSSLLELRLDTGRTHQIRVHMTAIGHPVLGDDTYGGARRFGLARQFLHAHRLVLDHPLVGERLEWRSDLPVDLEAALEKARGGGTESRN